MDNPRVLFSPGFIRRNNDTFIGALDMPRFDWRP